MWSWGLKWSISFANRTKKRKGKCSRPSKLSKRGKKGNQDEIQFSSSRTSSRKATARSRKIFWSSAQLWPGNVGCVLWVKGALACDFAQIALEFRSADGDTAPPSSFFPSPLTKDEVAVIVKDTLNYHLSPHLKIYWKRLLSGSGYKLSLKKWSNL